MSKQVNAKTVGLFIIIGFFIFFGIIAKFTLNRIMPSQNNLFVMYFQESVKGLNVGSPVVLEGVEIGKVSQIELIANPQTLDFSIPVYIRFNKIREVNDVSFLGIVEKKKMLADMIHRGLRARLATQSYLTGQLMIELIMLPESKVVLKNDPQTRGIPEIPTTLSTIGELSKGFQDLPLREMVDRTNRILSTVETQLPIILPQISQMLETVHKTAEEIDKAVPKSNQAFGKMNQTLNNSNRTLNDISNAAKSIRNLADYLERHPESLLKGKGK